MKSATELLSEMLFFYDEPDKDAADLYLWVHRWQGEIRAALDRARGEGE